MVQDLFAKIVANLTSCLCFFQAEDGVRDVAVTGVQTCALPILSGSCRSTSTAESSSTDKTPTWVWALLAILAVALVVAIVLLATRRGRGPAVMPEAERSEERRVGKECGCRRCRYRLEESYVEPW